MARALPVVDVAAPRPPGTARFDFVLVGLVGVIATLGLFNLYSASRFGDEALFVEQIWRMVVGVGAAVVVAAVGTRVLERAAYAAWAMVLVLLAVTLAVGVEINGARRWLNLGFMLLQPSELAKVALITAIARYAGERKRLEPWDLADLARVAVLVLPACALVLLEPDLGHTVMFLVIAGTMVLFAGVQLKAMAVVLMVVVPAVPVLWWLGAIQAYQIGRVAEYVGLKDPATLRAAFQAVAGVAGAVGAGILLRRVERKQTATRLLVIAVAAASLFATGRGAADVARSMGWWGVRTHAEITAEAEHLAARADGYQALQSKIAIGSGGLVGKGMHTSTQSAFGFLPYHMTDFVYAHLSEEHGFVGAVGVLLVFLLLLLWALRIAVKARDRFGSFVAAGVAALFFWHVVVNVGMVLGVLPVVGMTLPLFSYGGSSVLTIFIATGLLFSVSVRGR